MFDKHRAAVRPAEPYAFSEHRPHLAPPCVNEVRRANPRRILDVVTGTGDLAIALAQRIRDVQVMGVDLSEEMLAVARRKVEAGAGSAASSSNGAMPNIWRWPTPRSMRRPSHSGCAISATSRRLRELARTIRPGAKSLSWSSRGPATGCSGRCTSSTPTRYCPASADWCRATKGLRVSAGFGGGVPLPGGVSGDDGKGRGSGTAGRRARVAGSRRYI